MSSSQSALCVFSPYSYDNDGMTRDEVKEKFFHTMEFVENYLRDVVSQSFPFSDKEKNKLTFEVCFCILHHSGDASRQLIFLPALLLLLSGGELGQKSDLFWLL